MATTKPFAYNTGTTISGTEQVGDIAIGTTEQDYSSEIGGVTWWMGPDEDLGYVIAHPTITGNQPNPLDVSAYIGFWRTQSKTESDFIDLSEYVARQQNTPQTFISGNEAYAWLNSNGFWTSYVPVTQTPTPTPSIQPTQLGLILDWDIQKLSSYGGSGTIITDLEGNSNGTLVGTIDYSSSSPNYLNIQGSSSEYIVSNTNLNPYLSPPNTGTEISLFIWAYPTGNGILVNEQGTTTPATSWHDSQIEIVSGELKFRVWQLSPPYITSSVPIILNTWNYIGFTYNGTTLTAYLNGQSVGSANISRLTPYNDGGGVGLYYSLGATDTITNMGDGNGATFRFGSFQVYNKGLTAGEVLSNYNNTKDSYIPATPTPTPTNTNTPTPTSTPSVPVTSNLVLYYDPSNPSSYSGTGTTINDLSGNGLNGTMSNITFDSPYFLYNGSSSQIQVADNTLLEPGSGSWTIEVWVNQSVSGNDVVLGKFNNGGASQQVSYSIRTTNTTYYAQIGSGVGSGSSLFINSTNYVGTLNTWYQIVYVFKNGVTKTLETFVNGTSIGTVSHNLASILNSTNPLYIGSYNGGEYSQWFDGKIGITRLYSSALSSADVLQNFNFDKSKYGL